MAVLVASNALMFQRRTLQTLLNSGHWFSLYYNDLEPTPANILSDFVEASFNGYAAFNLAGQFSTVLKQVDGEYYFTAQTSLFACESGGQLLYGGYIHDGKNVKLSQRLMIRFKCLRDRLSPFQFWCRICRCRSSLCERINETRYVHAPRHINETRMCARDINQTRCVILPRINETR